MARERYTHGHHESVLRSHEWRTIANSAAYLEPHLRPGVSLLDVGCGPGTITAEFADRVAPDGSVLGIDASSDVIALATEKQARPNLTFAVGDVYALDAADDSYDIVHAHQVLQHLGDPVAALVEMRRVCRPGGVVAVREVDYPTTAIHPATPELDEWLRLFSAATTENGGHPDAGRRLLSWVHAAGFTDVTPTASAWCFATPEDRAWWGGMWADRITESALADQAVAAGRATRDDLNRIADAWRAWMADDDAWFGVVHGEVIARA
ncbi:MAG TPA: methyltransferase domain-containing protein [Actinomycetes bacterium]|nr:methyltransferase domain-containing protein [Actinomycetes bacterium]